MRITTRRLGFAGAAVLVLAVAGIGVAAAAPPVGADPAEPAALERPAIEAGDDLTTADAPGQLRRLLNRRMVHAEIVLDRGAEGLVTVQLDRGTIKAIGARSLTIAQAGDRTETVATGDTTRVRKDRQRATLADLRVGDQVLVVSRVETGKAEASLVVVPVPRLARPAASAAPAP